MGALNRWVCNEPGCNSAALGNGSAIGLRAIGWWLAWGKRERYITES